MCPVTDMRQHEAMCLRLCQGGGRRGDAGMEREQFLLRDHPETDPEDVRRRTGDGHRGVPDKFDEIRSQT